MTNIAHISKGATQNNMKDWRPIIVCNVLYKLVSKVLANQQKDVLPKCILFYNYVFVFERSILDNAMVAIEIVHYMMTKSKGREGSVTLKLDISKSYDPIDWDYLKEVMKKWDSRNNVSSG